MITNSPVGGGAYPVLSDGNPDDVNDQFPDPDIGPPEDPEDDTQPDSSMVTGNLGSLVVVGADSPGTWSIIGTDGLPEVYSQGAMVSYRVAGDTIEAYVPGNGDDVGDRIVFTFELQTNGDYTYTQFDQLDHLPPIIPEQDGPHPGRGRTGLTKSSWWRYPSPSPNRL